MNPPTPQPTSPLPPTPQPTSIPGASIPATADKTGNFNKNYQLQIGPVVPVNVPTVMQPKINPLNGFSVLDALSHAATSVINAASPTLSADNAPFEQNVVKIANGIGYNETRGEKDPYGFYRNSNNPKLGNALGRYQVTEGELKAYGPRYLGRVPTAQEFLGNPHLQDAYVANKAQALLQQGYTPQQVADIHRAGITNASAPGTSTYQNPQYVKSFNDFYMR